MKSSSKQKKIKGSHKTVKKISVKKHAGFPHKKHKKRVRMKYRPVKADVHKQMFVKTQVPIPMKVKGFTPQLTRFSGQFNDFNKEWRNEREKPHKNPYQLLSHYGSQAQGFYHHNKEPIKIIKFHKFKPPRVVDLDPVELQEEKQRTEQGAEIAGKTKFSHKQALREIKQKMKKHNKGINEKKGYYAAGWRYRAYQQNTQREDGKYQQENAKADEFRSIEKGQQEMEELYAQHPDVANGFA